MVQPPEDGTFQDPVILNALDLSNRYLEDLESIKESNELASTFIDTAVNLKRGSKDGTLWDELQVLL